VKLTYVVGTTFNDESIHRSVSEIVGEENIIPPSENPAYAVDRKVPRVATFPNNADAISKLLVFANRSGLSVVPRGSGTKMDLGGVPRTVDVVLSLLNLNNVIEYEPDDLVVTAQAGLKLAELQKTLAKNGQRLPLDPPYSDETTLGGIISSNSSGPMRYRYGSCRDLLLGLKVVSGSGAITRSGGKVVKDVAGYDLKKLYIGALGTLGIITELTLRLCPLPESERTFIAAFSDMRDAANYVDRVLGSNLLPYAVDALNQSAAKAVADEADVRLGESKYTLVVGFGDVNESVKKQLATIEELARSSGAIEKILLEGYLQESMWNAIRNLSRLLGRGNPNLIGLKACVPISRGLETFQVLEHLAAERGFTCAASSHVGNGIDHFFLSTERGRQTPTSNDLAELITKARHLTSQMGGMLIAEKCPVEVKELVDVWDATRADVQFMRAIKSRLDPGGILSPGRFVGSI